ncbi:MAG: MerR family transcriptional regulator [Steroidobacteraceae bacterium]|nr:MerR family transcriptional regulator [Steroidobacteraceae bacterium]
MLLKVGELAKRTGVTVRALHHYDSIGLLRPSGRSESGYRLYNRDDVARLHGIQTLRQMGVPLAEMAQLLDGGASALQAILARQLRSLDQEIARAQALRERLGVMQFVLAGGGQPEIDDWLTSLAMMSTLEKYFSVEELKLAFTRWKQCEAEWPSLVQAIHAAMDRGVPPDSIEIQPLVQRWMDLASRWMDGDLEFLGRWGSMLREQPGLPLPAGMDLELLDFIDDAIRRRLAVLAQYISPEEQQRVKKTRPQWRALLERAERLMADGVPPHAPAARELALDWRALMDRTVGRDAALGERLLALYENEPLLQAGMAFTPALRHYIEQSAGP